MTNIHIHLHRKTRDETPNTTKASTAVYNKKNYPGGVIHNEVPEPTVPKPFKPRTYPQGIYGDKKK